MPRLRNFWRGSGESASQRALASLAGPGRTSSRFWIPVGLVVWIASLAGGFSVLLEHGFEAGVPAGAEAGSAAALQGLLDDEKPSLLMFAHPKCPCTTASLAELERLLAQVGDTVVARCYFFMPEGGGAAWSDTRTRRIAANIAGLEIAEDSGGDLARAIGVETSGQVLLVAPDGELLYRGGLTASRGHEGVSLGGSAVRDWILRSQSEVDAQPVFGCSLSSSLPAEQ